MSHVEEARRSFAIAERKVRAAQEHLDRLVAARDAAAQRLQEAEALEGVVAMVDNQQLDEATEAVAQLKRQRRKDRK